MRVFVYALKIQSNPTTFYFALHYHFILQKGEVNLENVTHEEAVATLKATQDRVVLIVAKPDSAFTTAPSEPSYSPKLCKSIKKIIGNIKY